MDISDAFDRMKAFCAVQTHERGGYTPGAVTRLQEAVGVGDAERAVISERLGEFGDVPAGAVLLGVLLGLFAAQA